MHETERAALGLRVYQAQYGLESRQNHPAKVLLATILLAFLIAKNYNKTLVKGYELFTSR